MRRPNTRIFVAILILLIGGVGTALVLPHLLTPPSPCRNLSCVTIPGATAFRLKDLYTDTPTVYRALYVSGTKYIRIEAQKTISSDAQKELNASVTRMKALFEKAPAPYPGDISDAIVCDSGFAPRYATAKLPDGTPMQYFVGYLNNRMTFGSCSQDQAVYRGTMAFLYCPADSVSIRVELIAPTKEFETNEPALEQQILTMRCRKDH